MLGNSHRTCRVSLGSIALGGILILLGSAGSWAQTASNVNCAKCVDTGDIAKKAVDRKKLAKGAVDSSRIADGGVKTKDLADGAVEQSKLADGSVSSAKLADGAVTGSKLAAGAVDGTKLADGAIGGSKIADGAVTMAKLAPDAVFRRIIVVRADPLDPVGNCDALINAVANTNSNANNRFLIHLDPGIYDCGGTSLQMRPYADIEGSGPGVTVIMGSVGASGGVVLGSDNVVLRQLSVVNSGAADTAIAIVAQDVSRFRIADVTAIGRDSDIVVGIDLNLGGSKLTNVVAEAINGSSQSTAIRLRNFSGATMVNVTARADDLALDVSEGTVTSRNSVFSGTTATFVNAFDGIANFVSSQLDGGKDPSGTGTYTCVGAYDGAFIPLNDTCD